jgi:hypothetical protein
MDDLSASAKPRLRPLLDHFSKIEDTRQEACHCHRYGGASLTLSLRISVSIEASRKMPPRSPSSGISQKMAGGPAMTLTVHQP